MDAVAGVDVLFLAVSGDFAREHEPTLKEKYPRLLMIDNSSAWRMDGETPLVVPEINGNMVPASNLIANPNCTTAILAVCLKPLHEKYGLKNVIVSTYQAASGAGQAGMEEEGEGAGKRKRGGAKKWTSEKQRLRAEETDHLTKKKGWEATDDSGIVATMNSSVMSGSMHVLS